MKVFWLVYLLVRGLFLLLFLPRLLPGVHAAFQEKFDRPILVPAGVEERRGSLVLAFAGDLHHEIDLLLLVGVVSLGVVPDLGNHQLLVGGQDLLLGLNWLLGAAAVLLGRVFKLFVLKEQQRQF